MRRKEGEKKEVDFVQKREPSPRFLGLTRDNAVQAEREVIWVREHAQLQQRWRI